MSGCHAPCDTDSNNSFFDGNEEMGVRFPPTQLIRISVLKLNMERWRNGRRGSYVQYIMFVVLTANLTAWGLLHCWFKSNSLQSRRWHKRPYKSQSHSNPRHVSAVRFRPSSLPRLPVMVNRREHDCDNACVPHSNRVYGFKSCRGN